MKRHVHAPQRTVTVEDGTVRDLDGNLLGEVERSPRPRPAAQGWEYRTRGAIGWVALFRTRDEAVDALLGSPFCPAGGPNLYDKGAAR